MKKPERSSYTSIDFREWNAAGTLEISPKFQRRGVWSRPARSSLIDTLLLGLPIPPIYIRVVQNGANTKIVREIVDGQQRLRAVLEFMEGEYSLSKNIDCKNAINKYFDKLSADQKAAIEQYSFICETMYGVEDSEVLRIFARLNTYSVSLNAQELRNGKFFGEFKQSAYNLALDHLEYWRMNKIFTEQRIARMLEVELVSELMIASLSGMQDKKSSINSFYETHDDHYSLRTKIEKNFRSVIDACGEALPDGLKGTEFRRVPLFYSLYCAVYHRLYGLPGEELPSNHRGRLTKDDSQGIADAVFRLSEILEEAKNEDEQDKDDISSSRTRRLDAFVTACESQTDNLRPRQTRMRTIYRTAFM